MTNTGKFKKSLMLVKENRDEKRIDHLWSLGESERRVEALVYWRTGKSDIYYRVSSMPNPENSVFGEWVEEIS